jgi:hypothetical protein
MDVGGGGEMTGANALLTLQQSDRELARLFIEVRLYIEVKEESGRAKSL